MPATPRPPLGPRPGERHSARELCVIEIGDGWAVRWRGELRLVASFETMRQALNAALHKAWEDQVDVLVQQRDGTFNRMRPLQPVEPEPKRRRGANRAPPVGSTER